MVTALARYNLMVGSTATDNYAKAYPGLQAKDNLYTDEYPIAFANNNKKKPGCTGNKCYLGYWANDDGSLKDAYKNEEQTNYPCKVFDANSLLWEPVQNYKAYFINTLNKTTVNMRLISWKELLELGCKENRFDNRRASCTYGVWFGGLGYWTQDTYGFWSMEILSTSNVDPTNFWNDSSYGVRPVIEISKSELQ